MGVYIKDMEMPTSCDKCIHSAWSNFYQIYVCNAVRKNEPVLFDGKQIKSTAVARSARADNCPLVEVPPHGRVIVEDDAIETAWMILAGLGYRREENPQLEQTVREVYATAPAIEVEEHG